MGLVPTKDARKTEGSAATRSGARIPKLTYLKDPSSGNIMSLQLHLNEAVARTNMTAPEREWRKKWILDQRLHPDEPIAVEALHRQLNPIRRIYRLPWDMLYMKVLEPSMGTFYANKFRSVVPKLLIGYVSLHVIHYWMKYHYKDWTTRYGMFYKPPKAELIHWQEIERDHPNLLHEYFVGERDGRYLGDHGGRFLDRTVLKEVAPPNRPW